MHVVSPSELVRTVRAEGQDVLKEKLVIGEIGSRCHRARTSIRNQQSSYAYSRRTTFARCCRRCPAACLGDRRLVFPGTTTPRASSSSCRRRRRHAQTRSTRLRCCCCADCREM